MTHAKDIAVLIVSGMGGALVRSLIVHRGSIMLWRTWKTDTKRGVDLGILSTLIIGAVTALVVDQNPGHAFVWSLAGSHVLEEMMKGPARITEKQEKEGPDE